MPRRQRPAQKVSIDQILQAGWYLLALINEVLDLSLIESGKTVFLQRKNVACRSADRLPGDDGTAGAEARHHHDFSRFRRALLRHGRPDTGAADSGQSSVQRHQIQPPQRHDQGGMRRPQGGLSARLRQRHRHGADAGQAQAAFPALQSPGPGGRHRTGHRHRSGGDQAAGRSDERHHRRGKRGRQWHPVLDRPGDDQRRRATISPRPTPQPTPRTRVKYAGPVRPCCMSRTIRPISSWSPC